MPEKKQMNKKRLSDFLTLVEEYDFLKNSKKPCDYTVSSGLKVWWRCAAGHSWQATIAKRTGQGTKCPYCTHRKAMPGETDLATLFPDVAAEFDTALNQKTPQDYTASSNKKVWWQCKAKGHRWQATIASRTAGCGCPYCQKHRPSPGENSLATIAPLLLEEYNWARNTEDPEQLAPTSKKQIWWKCKVGHEWKATIGNRVINRTACPYCSGRMVIPGQTDLATIFPKLAAEFDLERNDKGPTEYTSKSNAKVYWKCKEGHVWRAAINTRAAGNNCPFCAHQLPLVGETDLATVYPALAAEFDLERNTKKPTEYTSKSNQRVWWKCRLKGHKWCATIRNRANGDDCPFCSGRIAVPGETDLETLSPNLAKEFDREKNRKSPKDYTVGSHQKVWWQCRKGHSWQATVFSRTNGSPCPYCAGLLPIRGKTDFETLEPDLAKEFDTHKNTRQIWEYTRFSNTKVFWLCSIGHSWRSSIANRVRGRGCPMCRKHPK